MAPDEPETPARRRPSAPAPLDPSNPASQADHRLARTLRQLALRLHGVRWEDTDHGRTVVATVAGPGTLRGRLQASTMVDDGPPDQQRQIPVTVTLDLLEGAAHGHDA